MPAKDTEVPAVIVRLEVGLVIATVGAALTVHMAFLVAVQDLLVPPFEPLQLHVIDPPGVGKAGEVGEAVPLKQNVPE